jgi:two-component system KDP operon response regulator KdpE
VTGPQRDLRILHVEDEALNRELVKAILARATEPRLVAAWIIEAETLAQARAVLAEGPVDVVLLDVQLPDGSGLTLASELRSGPSATRPVVIAVTAGAVREQHAAALAAGCDAILTKPYLAAELEAILTAGISAHAVLWNGRR